MGTDPDPLHHAVSLVDSNVVLDVINVDPRWSSWADSALAEARDTGWLVINPLIYAEVSLAFDTLEELDEAVSVHDFRREALPFEAGFMAGKAFVTYRRRGGVRTSPMPDFYIGAHAAVRGYRLLTRDPTRYRTYFPTVDLISP